MQYDILSYYTNITKVDYMNTMVALNIT